MNAILFLVVATLAACHYAPQAHRGVGTGAGSSGSAGSGTGAGNGHVMGKDSWYGMCALDQRLMDAHTAEERQAIAEQVMPHMSQESRERHRLMMERRCH